VGQAAYIIDRRCIGKGSSSARVAPRASCRRRRAALPKPGSPASASWRPI